MPEEMLAMLSGRGFVLLLIGIGLSIFFVVIAGSSILFAPITAPPVNMTAEAAVAQGLSAILIIFTFVIILIAVYYSAKSK